MSDEIFERIKSLVVKQMGRYRKPLTRETCLEKDLGMTGDDAFEFIRDFSKQFDVDISKFEMRKYFMPEADSVLPMIIRLFTDKKNPKEAELKLGDLEKAAIAGRLDDNIISGQN